MMALQWVAKVEYVCDGFNTDIDVSWFMDLCLDDCPSYDPDRTYRAFWSPIEGDSPDLMLEKVPQIPILSEKQQKAREPGYYEVVILGIEDNADKFKLTRIKKSVKRGTKDHAKPGKSSSSSKATPKPQSKPADKVQATAKNLGQGSRQRSGSALKGFEKKIAGENEEHDFDSDDSTKDPTLISESQVKVIKSSLKNLKKKLLEKCEENEELKKKLSERDTELISLRELNRGLQETILQKMTSTWSTSSSRSSSLSSLNLPRSLPPSPLCNRSRSVSTSSSCSGLQSRSNSPLAAERPSAGSPQLKRKTPPTTPTTGSGFKRVFHDRTNEKENTAEENSPSISRAASFDDNSSNTTLMNDSTSTVEATNESHNIDTPAATVDDPADESQIQFCEGFKVDKKKLQTIEKRALGSSNDGSYVKELAVAVFGIPVLYHSSTKGRRYSKTNAQENEKVRDRLDERAVEEIRARLQKRVQKEFNGNVPEEERIRYKATTVGRLIYEKIKKLRQSPNYDDLKEQGPKDKPADKP